MLRHFWSSTLCCGSVGLPVCLSACLPVCRVYLSVHRLHVGPSVSQSVCVSLCSRLPLFSRSPCRCPHMYTLVHLACLVSHLTLTAVVQSGSTNSGAIAGQAGTAGAVSCRWGLTGRETKQPRPFPFPSCPVGRSPGLRVSLPKKDNMNMNK